MHSIAIMIPQVVLLGLALRCHFTQASISQTMNAKDCKDKAGSCFGAICCGSKSTLGDFLPLMCGLMDKTDPKKPSKTFNSGEKSGGIFSRNKNVLCSRDGYKLLRIEDENGKMLHRVSADDCNDPKKGGAGVWIKAPDDSQYGILCDTNPLPTVLPTECRFQSGLYHLTPRRIPVGTSERVNFDGGKSTLELSCQISKFATAAVTASLTHFIAGAPYGIPMSPWYDV